MNKNNRCVGGRNWNQEPTCGSCRFLERDTQHPSWGGVCGHPDNRIPPSPGWPDGGAPSQSPDGGCDLHAIATGVQPIIKESE